MLVHMLVLYAPSLPCTYTRGVRVLTVPCTYTFVVRDIFSVTLKLVLMSL